MIRDGRWSPAAELVFWREQPAAWEWKVPADLRFADALDVCLASLPEEEADKIASVVDVTEAQVTEALARRRAWYEEQREKYGPNARLRYQTDPDGVRRSLVFNAASELDWLFFRGWRLPDGWLSSGDRDAALEIFHDPLAIQMRRAVVRHLHPKSDVARSDR